MDRLLSSLFHMELNFHNQDLHVIQATPTYIINVECIKNFLICEKDIKNINKLMKYLNIKWDTPIDSVDNTPLHILTNAEYINLTLLDQLPIEDVFFKCKNANRITPFISFIYNWKLFKNKETYEIYDRILRRIITHLPLNMINPTSEILHDVIPSLNLVFIKMLSSFVHFKKWTQLYSRTRKLPIEILYDSIRKYGIDEDTFPLFIECEQFLIYPV